MSQRLKETGDWELLARAARGSEAAYGRLVLRHHDAAMAFTIQMLGDYQKAEDVVQKAFGNVFRGRHRFVEKARFKTFLYRILTNLSLNQLAKRKSATAFSAMRRGDEDQDPTANFSDPNVNDPGRAMELAEVDDMLTKALSTLRPQHRAALWLREQEGQSYSEIAETLDATLSEIKIWIHRARTKMVAILKPYLDDGRAPE